MGFFLLDLDFKTSLTPEKHTWYDNPAVRGLAAPASLWAAGIGYRGRGSMGDAEGEERRNPFN